MEPTYSPFLVTSFVSTLSHLVKAMALRRYKPLNRGSIGARRLS
jgi:hypothetical protein